MTGSGRVLAIVTVTAWLVAVPAGASTRTVTIPAKTFDPVSITITIGDTVQWIDNDSKHNHTVTATSASAAAGEDFTSSHSCGSLLFSDCMRSGDVFRHTFHTVGTFVYYCQVHGRDTSYPNCLMCGIVKVKKKSPPPTTGSTSPSPSASGTATGSPSPSPTDSTTPTTSPTSSGGTGQGGGGGGAGTPIAVAGLAVAFLGGSGYLVYRTMIRR
jgi:plastocyanin